MLDVNKLISGDKRTAAKLITLIENDGEGKTELLSQIYPHTGAAHVIGITGSPGAGKSSLTDELIGQARRQDMKVGVIAVDPTSPISGGALLGDRIRMQEHALDRNVFIRSMGTRGCLGGLARATNDVVKVLDAYGCQVILIETVGVGQSELDIMHYADTTLVVLNPGGGDQIQTIKAGIMEIADIFVINKSDLGGTKRMVTDIEQMLDMSPRFQSGWVPPVMVTSTLTKEGLEELWLSIREHFHSLRQNDVLNDHLRSRANMELMDLVEEELRKSVMDYFNCNDNVHHVLKDLTDRKTDPYTAARSIVKQILNPTTTN